MKNAFVDANSVLMARGFVATDSTGQTAISVPDDFDLALGQWKFVNGRWVAVP